MKRMKRAMKWYLLLLGSVLLFGCQPNFVVRHRSKTSRPIHVYVDKRLHCVVAPGNACSSNLKRGRHSFFAEVKGDVRRRWASQERPYPFVVDRRTVIDLHEPRSKESSTQAGGLGLRGNFVPVQKGGAKAVSGRVAPAPSVRALPKSR